MTATSVPKGAKRRCESQAQERHQGKPAKMNTELIPKHNTKICYPSIAAVMAEMGVFF